MKLLFDEAGIDRIVADQRRNLRLGAGLLALVFLLPRGWACGGITGFMILSLGIYAASLSRWRTETGLWMLATLLTLILGGSWAYFESLGIWSFFADRGAMPAPRERTWEEWKFAVDSVCALHVFGTIARFTASVSVANWKVIRGPALSPRMPFPPSAEIAP